MNMMRAWGGLSPYEDYKIADMVSRKANGGTVTAIVLGSVGLAAALGAWVFGPMVSNSRANGVRDLANARYDATTAQIATIANLLGVERAERVAQGITLTNTVTDSVQGSQQGTLTAQQAAELSSIQSVQQNLLNQAIMGNMSQAPQKVAIWRDATACGCPGCGA